MRHDFLSIRNSLNIRPSNHLEALNFFTIHKQLLRNGTENKHLGDSTGDDKTIILFNLTISETNTTPSLDGHGKQSLSRKFLKNEVGGEKIRFKRLFPLSKLAREMMSFHDLE